MDNIVKQELGYRARVMPEDHPENPRDWDNMAVMCCAHKRYTLGDHQFSEVSDLLLHIKDAGEVVTKPLYLYDHSGITISTSAFSCPWDSGQVGEIYVELEKLKSEFGLDKSIDSWDTVIDSPFGEDKEKITLKALAYSILDDEVKDYDTYLRGDIYEFVVERQTCSDCDTWEVEEAVCGFYDYEEAKDRAIAYLDALVARSNEQHKLSREQVLTGIHDMIDNMEDGDLSILIDDITGCKSHYGESGNFYVTPTGEYGGCFKEIQKELV